MTNTFSTRLKQLRFKNAQCQRDLAAYLDVSVGTISNYENGTHQPDLTTIIRIAQFYRVTVDYLLGRTNHPWPIDEINREIADNYSVGQFLMLLRILPEEEKEFLVHEFCSLERGRE